MRLSSSWRLRRDKSRDSAAMSNTKLLARYRIDSPRKVSLKDWNTDDTGPFTEKDEAAAALAKEIALLDTLQEKLYAGHQAAMLMVLQATDTAGKDGVVRKVIGPLNAQGVSVTSFKKPTAEELSHDFLWRIHKACPAKGDIEVFNRSHYEDVLVVRVHKLAPDDVIERRYEQINAFEETLARSGTCIVKFFLHISKAEQKRRLEDRLADPNKHWKFNSGDVSERALWDQYTDAYEIAIGRCASKRAPWYIIPANKKWYRSWLIARILRHHLEALALTYPVAPPEITKIKIPD